MARTFIFLYLFIYLYIFLLCYAPLFLSRSQFEQPLFSLRMALDQ
uniref:Uncharacterized protein n=1 Tax=Anguilla anguilla TaxID=7936 RepID=A0A0E9PPW6_ANGAN